VPVFIRGNQQVIFSIRPCGGVSDSGRSKTDLSFFIKKKRKKNPVAKNRTYVGYIFTQYAECGKA